MLLPLAAMDTLSYHTLITALQIKSSIHHIFIYYCICIGSIHKRHENLKRQSWFFIQFHSWPHFYGTPPCSVRFFACYSSSITTNIRSNCWSNLLLLHLVISVETINLKIVRHFLFFWMDAVFHNNVDPRSGDNNLLRTKHREKKLVQGVKKWEDGENIIGILNYSKQVWNWLTTNWGWLNLVPVDPRRRGRTTMWLYKPENWFNIRHCVVRSYNV